MLHNNVARCYAGFNGLTISRNAYIALGILKDFFFSKQLHNLLCVDEAHVDVVTSTGTITEIFSKKYHPSS